MTHTPDDSTRSTPRDSHQPIVPSTTRAMWPWVVGGAVLIVIAVALAIYLLTPPELGMGQFP